MSRTKPILEQEKTGWLRRIDKPAQGHTPGPWRAVVNNGRGSEWHIGHRSENHVGGQFCTVEALHITPEAIATAQANARLIAAAPELYQTLKDLVGIVCSMPGYDERDVTIEDCDEAKGVLAKVAGDWERVYK